jgi:lipopolysaccharide export system permease protein
MIILERYLIKSSLTFIGVALLLLAGMETIFALIAELEDMRQAYGFLQVAIFVGLTLPRRIYEFLPVSVLIGTLFSLGQMAQNSELVVMRASAFSVFRIVGAVLKAGLVFALCGLLLSEFVVPYSQQVAQSYRALKQGDGTVLRVRQGNWQKEGNQLIHVAALAPNGNLYGVTRIQFDDQQQLQSITYSAEAQFHRAVEENQEVDGRDFWLLKNNLSTRLTPEKIDKQQEETATWFSQLTPEAMAMVIMEPEFLSISGLHRYTQFLQWQQLRYQPYLLAFWKKVLQPIASLVMVLLAISFIFGPLRSVTMGFRIVMGLIAGMGFYYLQDLMGYISLVFNFSAFGAALLPMLVFAAGAGWLLKRVR